MVLHQACTRGPETEDIKAGVAKSGNGMEKRVPHTREKSKLARKEREQKEGSHHFNNERDKDDELCQPHNAADLRSRDGLLHCAALHQADFFS